MFVILTVGHIKFETKKSAQLLIKESRAHKHETYLRRAE